MDQNAFIARLENLEQRDFELKCLHVIVWVRTTVLKDVIAAVLDSQGRCMNLTESFEDAFKNAETDQLDLTLKSIADTDPNTAAAMKKWIAKVR